MRTTSTAQVTSPPFNDGSKKRTAGGNTAGHQEAHVVLSRVPPTLPRSVRVERCAVYAAVGKANGNCSRVSPINLEKRITEAAFPAHLFTPLVQKSPSDQIVPPRRARLLHVRRPGARAARRAHAAGRRPPARPDALALLRGAVPARARAARRRAGDRRRREGPAEERRSATRTP